jgi:cytochrome c-type biogenesis protein CcmH
MTGFILGALLLAVLAAMFVAWPLLRRQAEAAPAGLAAGLAVLLLLGGSAIGYGLLGNRSWMQADAAHAGGNIAALARHLESEPQDQAGWLDLGGAYASIGQFSLAQRAYGRANRLANGGNASALAGIAEAMLMSGDNAQAAQAPEYIERALLLDPKSPKALFYGAVVAYGEGRFDVARARFAAMLTLTPPPPPNVRVAIQQQLTQIDAKLHPQLDPATAIHLHVTLAAALAAKVPANASLFVFVRSPEGGAPLAAKRSAVSLPQDVELSAADSMIAGHAVQPGQKVSVVARISASGSPLPQSGDLYGQVEYVAGKSGARALEIDRLSP